MTLPTTALMTDLYTILSRLGLAQYVETFSEEGFETWDTVLDITESDLDALGVKLGHRRVSHSLLNVHVQMASFATIEITLIQVLQREIARTRGMNVAQPTSPCRPGHHDHQGNGGDQSRAGGQGATGTGGKRKYRRHPKADKNAPERPPSAYVIFSNKIREELKPESLSFTAIAKRVGERWQDIPAEEKEQYESEASEAKEKYHAEMADYKTTRAYREYQQYLVEFKAKHALNSDGKRPKPMTDETQESTTSSGSIVSQLDDPESLSGITDIRYRNVGSVGSEGLYSVTSGLPSSGNATFGSAIRRGGLSSTVSLGNTSPSSAFPSTPSACRGFSTGQSFPMSAQERPSAERQPERMVMTSLGSDQNHLRMPLLESTEARTLQGFAPGLFAESGISRGRRSPLGSPRHPARDLTQAGSSKSSTISNQTSSSTAASSLHSPADLDGEKRHPALSLPPLPSLESKANSNESSQSEQVTRSSLHPLAGRTALSFAQDQPSRSPFDSSSSTGMKFESLQLPLPYNISFGQHPLPRPDSNGNLADSLHLQDISRERNSLRDLTLEHEHEHGGSFTTMPRGPPEPQHPPHHPNLPSLPCLFRDDCHDPPPPHNSDPLSVLSYAGRIVGRERETPGQS